MRPDPATGWNPEGASQLSWPVQRPRSSTWPLSFGASGSSASASPRPLKRLRSSPSASIVKSYSGGPSNKKLPVCFS